MTQRYLIAIPRRPSLPAFEAIAAIHDRWVQDVRRCILGKIAIIRTADLPVHVLADGKIVLGDMFENLDVDDARASGACSQQCWGSRIELTVHDQGVSVHRDPAGQISLFVFKSRNHVMLCSDWKIARDLTGFVPNIDWDPVINLVVTPGFHSHRTGLRGFDEILPGETLSISDGRLTTRLGWSPAPLEARRKRNCRADPITAASSLRETIERSVEAMTARYRRPVLELSGGLDSSVVAAALARCRDDFVCLNYVTSSADGDEREQARHVARHLGLRLIEAERDIAGIDLSYSAAADLPRPSSRAFTQESDRLSLEVAEDVGGDCFLSGGGGDSIFFSTPSATPLQDRLRACQLGAQTFSTMLDVADIADRTCWWALKRALTGRRHIPHPLLDFLGANAIALVRREPMHPWLDSLGGTSAGLKAHVETIVGISGHLLGFDRARSFPLLFPLMAQPVMEECLSMPGWLWALDGYDRSLVRRAFASALPNSIVYRRSKGRLDLFGRALFQSRRHQIRDMLLGGILAQNGLVDIGNIEAEMARAGPGRDYRFYRLLELVDVEAWARSIIASVAVGSAMRA